MLDFKSLMARANSTHDEKASGARLREIIRILTKHRVLEEMTPEKLVALLQDLGPTYIKIGQILSNRSDMLPARYCQALSTLRSKVAPLEFTQVESLLDTAYGRPCTEIFSWLDPRPLGSASIAQVHRAKLHDGQVVAVKVQRPGIAQEMASDLALMHRATRIMARHAPKNARSLAQSFEAFVDELARTTADELDFGIELENLERFKAITSKQEGVSSPTPYREFSAEGVLVMEFVDGISFEDADAIAASGVDVDAVIKDVVKSYVEQVFAEGFFHADPHPGNVSLRFAPTAKPVGAYAQLGTEREVEAGSEGIAATTGKSLDTGPITAEQSVPEAVWMDLGMTGSLTPAEMFQLNRMIRAMILCDSYELKETALCLVGSSSGVNHGQLLTQIDQMLNRYMVGDTSKIDFVAAFMDMTEIMREQNLSLPRSFTMLGRGFMTLQGMVSTMAPEVSLVEMLAQHVKADLTKPDTVKELAQEAALTAVEATKATAQLPVSASHVLDMAEHGTLTVGADLHFSTDFKDKILSIAGLLCLAVISMGLFLGSSILCLSDLWPQVLGVPIIGAAGYLGAAVLSVYVILRILVNRHKERRD